MLGGRGLGGRKLGLRLTLAVAFGACITSCSGKSVNSGDEDDGGTSGTGAGGTGARPGSGGTGGSPRPPKLGLYLVLRNPDTATAEVAGRVCPASTGLEWDIGAPILENGMVIDVDSPSPTDFGSTLEDGEAETEISCSVTAGGLIGAEGGGIDPQFTPPNGLVSFTLAATASQSGGGRVSAFSVYTPLTLGVTTAAGYPPCTLPAVHQIAPGAVWGDIACPALIDTSRPDIACRAHGTFVMEYCGPQ